MKIRNGFVTNSSSSSFIIAYKSEEELNKDIEKVLEKEPFDMSYSHLSCGDLESKAREYILNGIKNGVMSKEEILKELKEEFESEARWKFFYSKRQWNFEYLESDEYKNKETEYVNEMIKMIEKELEGMGFVSYASFADEDGSIGSYAEHHAVPSLNGTIRRFSHH